MFLAVYLDYDNRKPATR